MNKPISFKKLKLGDIVYLLARMFLDKNCVIYSYDSYLNQIEIININEFDEYYPPKIIKIEEGFNDKAPNLKMAVQSSRNKMCGEKKTEISIEEPSRRYYLSLSIAKNIGSNDRTLSFKTQIIDGYIKSGSYYINDEKGNEEFEKYILRLRDKLNFFEENYRHVLDISSGDTKLFSLSTIYRLKKYIGWINNFQKRGDVEEYKRLLKDLIDISMEDTEPEKGYQNNIFGICSYFTTLPKTIVSHIRFELFTKNNYALECSELKGLLESDENPFEKREDFLRVFLPLFKEYGGKEAVQRDIIKMRIINE